MRNLDRQESIKSAVLAAIVTGIAALILAGGNHILASSASSFSLNLLEALHPQTLVHLELWTGAADVAIAMFSGALFGITYRYIASQQDNPHLRSGAVGAFGLVRGLALLEMGWVQGEAWLVLLVLGIESLVLFAIAAAILDICFQRNWVKLSGAV